MLMYDFKENNIDYDNIYDIVESIEVAKSNNVEGTVITGSRSEIKKYFQNLRYKGEAINEK